MDDAIKITNCIIVDDEPLAREVIHRYISKIPSLHLVAECSNAIQAITALQQHEVGLMFLDIQMPEILGTDLIKTLKHPPKTIITTAFSEYALEGYDLDVVDYLLKPVHFERFLKAINKVFHQGIGSATNAGPSNEKNNNTEPAYLYFRTDRKMVKVNMDDIIYVEGMKNYVKIFTTGGMLITKNSMAAMEAMLPEGDFVRVHRSYIVARKKITFVSGETIGIEKTEIPVGKLFKHNITKLLP